MSETIRTPNERLANSQRVRRLGFAFKLLGGLAITALITWPALRPLTAAPATPNRVPATATPPVSSPLPVAKSGALLEIIGLPEAIDESMDLDPGIPGVQLELMLEFMLPPGRCRRQRNRWRQRHQRCGRLPGPSRSQ